MHQQTAAAVPKSRLEGSSSPVILATKLLRLGPKTSGWLQLANGGGVPTFVLLNQRKNWADFEPLPKTVQDVLTETYGKDAADQLLKTIRDSTEHLYTEIGQYRADLSYIPAK